MSDEVSGYCDRHLIQASEYINGEHVVHVGANKWTLCDECKSSIHNWFGSFPNASDRVVQTVDEVEEETVDKVIKEI